MVTFIDAVFALVVVVLSVFAVTVDADASLLVTEYWPITGNIFSVVKGAGMGSILYLSVLQLFHLSAAGVVVVTG
jgi:hypothetical protein